MHSRVEATSNLITRHAIVSGDRDPEQTFITTSRAQYLNSDVVKSMPRGDGTEVDVIFFKVGRRLSDSDLGKEYELRGLVPADPYSQIAVNEADLAFADDHPNATHWKDADGNWCCAAFDDWGGGPGMLIGYSDDDWLDGWWFAGLRKVA